MQSTPYHGTDLRRIGIRDSLRVDPVSRFLVLRVVNLLGWINGGIKVLKQAARRLALTVE